MTYIGVDDKEYKTRVPKEGERIEYPCGCEFILRNVRDGVIFDVEPSVFCGKHDPTIEEITE